MFLIWNKLQYIKSKSNLVPGAHSRTFISNRKNLVLPIKNPKKNYQLPRNRLCFHLPKINKVCMESPTVPCIIFVIEFYYLNDISIAMTIKWKKNPAQLPSRQPFPFTPIDTKSSYVITNSWCFTKRTAIISSIHVLKPIISEVTPCQNGANKRDNLKLS